MALLTAIRDPSRLADSHEYAGPSGRPSVVSCLRADPSGATRQMLPSQRYRSESAAAGGAAQSTSAAAASSAVRAGTLPSPSMRPVAEHNLRSGSATRVSTPMTGASAEKHAAVMHSATPHKPPLAAISDRPADRRARADAVRLAERARRPARLPVGVAGPPALEHKLAAAGDAFDVHRYRDEAAARAAIEDREVYGAFVATPAGPKVLIASAASPPWPSC